MRDFGLVPSFACLMLAACVSIRASSPEQGAVSLTGMQTRAYPPIEHGAWGTLPAELQAALTKLPESVAPLDRPALTALARLRYARSRNGSSTREATTSPSGCAVSRARMAGLQGLPCRLPAPATGCLRYTCCPGRIWTPSPAAAHNGSMQISTPACCCSNWQATAACYQLARCKGSCSRDSPQPSSTHWTASVSARRSPISRCWPTAMRWRYGGKQIPNDHCPKTCQAPIPCTPALCMAATLCGPVQRSVSGNLEPHAGSGDKTGPAAIPGLVFPVLPDHTPKGHIGRARYPGRDRPAAATATTCMPSCSAGTVGEEPAGKHPGA